MCLSFSLYPCPIVLCPHRCLRTFVLRYLLCVVEINSSGGPNVLGSFLSFVFLTLSPIFSLCMTGCFTLNKEQSRESSLVLSRLAPFPFCCSSLLLLTTPKKCCPTRNLDCAIRICASISCVCWDQPSYSSTCILPPTTSCSSIRRRISVSSTPRFALCRIHNPSLSTCSRLSLVTSRRVSYFSSFFAVLVQFPARISSSFEPEQTSHGLCLPSFVFCPRPLHHSSTSLLWPWSRPDRNVVDFLVSTSVCPPQTCWFWFKSSSSSSSMSFIICSRFVFGQKVSAHKLQPW